LKASRDVDRRQLAAITSASREIGVEVAGLNAEEAADDLHLGSF